MSETFTQFKHQLFTTNSSSQAVQKNKIIKFLSLLPFFLSGFSLMGVGQVTTETFTTAGANTWVCPLGVTSITVECWGAGGGSGGVSVGSGITAGGGGGAGGSYVRRTSYSVTPGTVYNLSVGARGSAGASSGGAGGEGGSSWFGTSATIVAVGGNGGAGRTSSGYAAGGAAKTTGNLGADAGASFYGGAGGTGASGTAGGGGGSAGTGSDGNPASAGSGASAVTGGVAGVNGGSSSFSSGNTGNAGGGGAGGAHRTTSGTIAGSEGGAGKVVITYSTISYTTLTYSTASASTWVPPCGVTSVQIEAWGGGGGGGGGSTNGGSGGGGGAYSSSILNVTPGTTYYYSVGAAGTGGNNQTSTVPNAGGDAWFNSTNAAPTSTAGVLAKGGSAGTNNSLSAGGSGGLASSGYGQVKYSGGNGGAGGANVGGGGGSSAGTASGGNNGSTSASGTSDVSGGTAPTGGGAGGNGNASSTTNSGNGYAGSAPGGGGGGSDDTNGRTGGAGAVGQVIIRYIATTTPTAAVISSPANAGTNIGATGTTLNWTNGGGAATYNVFFGTTNPPTTQVGTNQVGTSYDPGTLSFNQTYYWRVDAVDASGCNTTTGSVWSFTTAAGACSANPTINTTTAASSIGATTASSGGSTITEGANCSITTKGVAYGIAENPDINGTKTTDGGTGSGDFSSSLTGLTAATLYYARAYVSNSFGTAYGNQISFRTLSAELSGHPASFSAAANGSSQIDLSFSAASTISASGYLIIQKQGSNPGFTPVDATAYTLGATVATGETVAAIITNTAATSTSILGLTLSTAYNFSIIPFTYDGTNTATYNYYTTASVPIPLGFRVATATTAASSTRYAVANGNWNSTSTWSATSGGSSGASIPGAGDDVIIDNGYTPVVNVNSSCKSITFNADNTLNNGLRINNNITLTLTGDITINGTNADRNTTIQGQSIGADGTAVLTGVANININDNPAASGSDKTLTVIMQDVNISVTSNVRLRSYIVSSIARNKTLSLRSGTLTIGGSMVMTSASGSTNLFTTVGGAQTGKLVFTGTTPWSFSSDFAPSTVNLTGTGSTVEYNGAGAQTIEPFNYNNLVSSNSGSRTLGTSNTAPLTGTIGIAGSFTPGSNSYTVTGSTVNFNGADQTIPSFTFGSLTVSGSGTKTLGGNVTLSGSAGSLTVSAGTLDLSSFTCNRASIPAGANTLTLAANTTLKIGGTNSFPSDYATHSISSSSTVEYAGTNQSVSTLNSSQNYGNLVISGSGTKTLGGNVGVAGNLTVSAGTFDLSSATCNRSAAGGTLSLAASTTLKIGGTNSFPSNYSTHSINSSSTVEYAGTTQSVATLNSSQNYGNLIISGSGTKTLGGTVGVAGNLTVSAGTFDLSTFTCNRSSAGGTLSLASSTALKIGGTNSFPTNYSTHSINSSSTVEYAGTTQSVATLNSSQNYGNLIISGSGTKTLGGTVGVAGNLTVSAGTFDLSTFTCNRSSAGGTLSLASSTTLKIGGTNSFPSNYSTHSINSTSTVEYAGTTQSVAALNSSQNYGNLIISGSGTKTLAGNATVAGDLTLTAGTFADGGNTLTLQGNLAGTGTHTSTGSGEILMNGSSRTISGATLGNLELNNSGGFSLSGSPTLSGTLALTSGVVTTSSNTLTIGVNGSISGASSSNYISGKLAWVFPSSGTNIARTFPVGKGGNYRPATFTYATASSQTVTIENFASATPLSLSTASTARFGSGYWNVNQSSTGTNYTIGLNNGGITQTTGATVVMLRREGTGSVTSNATSFSLPTYTNSSAFSTSNASNDVMLAETSIPLTITGVTANNKTYDGNTTATLNVGSAALSGVVGSDVVTLSSGSATGAFNDKNVGTGITVTTSGFSLSGANAGAYTLTQPSTTANITAKGLTASLTGTVSKTYDGTTSATLSTSNYSLTGVVGSEDVTVTNTSGSYNNKNVGTSKTVTVTSLVLGGADKDNYSISGNATGTVGTITARSLTITGASNSKTYDGTTSSATVPTITSGSIQGSDVAAFTQTYDNKNVGTSKVMTPSGVVTDGNSGNNYSYTFVTSSNGTITAKGLTASLTGTVSKTYDGTTTATLTTANYNITGVESGDLVTVTNTSGTYDDKNVGTDKTVTVSSPLLLGGAAAGNYTISGSATGTVGAITAKGLTASLIGTVTKTYDANTTATLTSANYSLTGVVGSEDVTVTNTSGTYDNKNVGTGKTVTVASLNLGGADEANYSISGTATGAVGVITKKELTITANNQNVLFGTAVATVTGAGSYTATGFAGGETTSVITGTATYTTNYTNTTAVGTTGITITPIVSGLSATNYSFTPANGTITISAASKTWVGQGLDKTGNWSVADNWSPSGVPNNSLHSIVINEGTPTLDINYTVVSGKNLTISGTGALVIAAGRSLTIAGTADFGGRPVTLKSTSSGTASIGQITGTLSNATAVTVERYMTARRKWRALTAPLTTSTNNGSIYANWQNGGSISTPNTGAIIWNPDVTSEGASGMYDGGFSSSMLSLNTSNNTWTRVANTIDDGTLFTSSENKAYMLFYTGPYNKSGNFIASGSDVSTLSATGTLRIGSFTTNYPSGWNMVGNPYASSIRTNGLNLTNLNNNGYIWNPGGSGTGVFTPITLNTAFTIQSGQAFFVFANSGGGAIGFAESSKVAGSSNSYFRTEENVYDGDLKIELNKYVAGSIELNDVAIVNYKSRPEAGLPKLAQFYENMSIYQDNLDYGMTTRKFNNGEDQIQLRLWQMKEANYQIKIDLSSMKLPAGSTAVLQDAFLNKETSLSTTEANKVDFNVTSNTASTGQRFRIVLRRANVPVTSTETPSYQIYPNPVQKGGNMQLEFRNQTAGKYEVVIYSMTGVRVQKAVVGHNGGTAIQQIALNQRLSSGSYLVEVIGEDGMKKQLKLVLQ